MTCDVMFCKGLVVLCSALLKKSFKTHLLKGTTTT